jgi:hypothetical protein
MEGLEGGQWWWRTDRGGSWRWAGGEVALAPLATGGGDTRFGRRWRECRRGERMAAAGGRKKKDMRKMTHSPGR